MVIRWPDFGKNWVRPSYDQIIFCGDRLDYCVEDIFRTILGYSRIHKRRFGIQNHHGRNLIVVFCPHNIKISLSGLFKAPYYIPVLQGSVLYSCSVLVSG